MNTTMTQCESTNPTQACQQVRHQTFRPRADIYEVDDAWLIMLEMPGVDESGADVAIEKNVLTVTGDVADFDTGGYDHRFGDLAHRRFERSFRLPAEVDTSGVDAQVKSGILRLRLPKAAAALPHKVTVKAG